MKYMVSRQPASRADVDGHVVIRQILEVRVDHVGHALGVVVEGDEGGVPSAEAGGGSN